MKEIIRKNLIQSLFSYRTHLLFHFDSNKVYDNASRMLKALGINKMNNPE